MEPDLTKVREFAMKETPAAARRLLDDLGLKAVSSSNQLGLMEPGDQRAANLDPRSFANQVSLADLFLYLRRPREARDAAERALSLAPNNLTAFEDKLVSFLAEGDLAKTVAKDALRGIALSAPGSYLVR